MLELQEHRGIHRLRRHRCRQRTRPAGTHPRRVVQHTCNIGRYFPAIRGAIRSPAGNATIGLQREEPQVRALFTCDFVGGQGRGRTADLPIFSRTLVPTELPGRAHGDRSPAGGAHDTGARGTGLNRHPRGADALWSPLSARPMLVSRASGRVRPPSSSGLGRRPFTAVARVRIPLGVLHVYSL